ncbi:unnamed protein product [Rotaria magnacalcarata]|uniref:Uncharacterized protein n=1 Tax=Rotaria magnacalcarata TaxID=392030 RepID=A0A814WCI8_9BILA|nr:unnamed protein product [Rotaria magnacalcarata]CAF4845795.1 unnamed protein product [Rotaria magnacalcarata]
MYYHLVYFYLLLNAKLFTIIHCLSSGDETSLTFTIHIEALNSWLVLMFLIILTVFFGILILYFIVYQLPSQMKTIIDTSKIDLLNASTKNIRTKKCRTLEDLTNFTPLKPYKTYIVNNTSSMETIEMLINEAKQTEKFSCMSYRDNKLYAAHLVLEFIQSTSSIIIDLKLNISNDEYMSKIRELLYIIFSSKNTIYSWGDLQSQLMYCTIYAMSITDQIKKSIQVDVQYHFKKWYNQTFHHDANCLQSLDFIQEDGYQCSCLHRPYKHKTDIWSMERAIMFTFQEDLKLAPNHLKDCLVITKLAVVIEKARNREEVEAFMKTCIK